MKKLALFAAALSVMLAPAARAAVDDVFLSAADAKALHGKPDVRFLFAEAEKDFEKEHIPGAGVTYAHDLSLLDDVRACKGLPMCEPAAAKLIGTLGIDDATKVVVYDAGAGPNATGLWFFLTLYGKADVKILDGGLASWKAGGGATEKGKAAPVAAKSFTPRVKWEMLANVDEVKQASADKAKYLLLDSRHNLDEYTGKQLLVGMKSATEHVTVKRGGSIPGAVFSPWTKYAGNKGGEPNQPTLKDAADVRKQLEKLKKHGYAEDKTVISYCHVGLGRGSFQYLALKKAGHDKVKLYVGSWNEWGNTESLPLGTPQ